MKRSNIIFLSLLFFVVLIINIYAIPAHPELRKISKILLMPILFVFYMLNTSRKRKSKNRILIVSALFFSWLGDIFLIGESDLSFLLGIAGFLFAQISYILYFSKEANGRKINFFIVPFLLFLFSFLFIMYKHILSSGENNSFLAPVTVYALIITTMAYFSTLRSKNPKSSYIMVISGAIFFLISDSCIAINSFLLTEQSVLLGKIVMLTYGVAQYLIISGVSKRNNKNTTLFA